MVEPLLFGLIGALVDISQIQPSLIGNSVLVLILAVLFRGCGAYLATLGVLGHNERLFMAGAWIPKATVPAALSSELYERAMALNLPTETVWGREVITIFIFMILVTAPLGAIWISVCGPLMLPEGEEEDDDEVDLKSFSKIIYDIDDLEKEMGQLAEVLKNISDPSNYHIQHVQISERIVQLKKSMFDDIEATPAKLDELWSQYRDLRENV